MSGKPWRARILAKYKEELDKWWADMAEEEDREMRLYCPECGCTMTEETLPDEVLVYCDDYECAYQFVKEK